MKSCKAQVCKSLSNYTNQMISLLRKFNISNVNMWFLVNWNVFWGKQEIQFKL